MILPSEILLEIAQALVHCGESAVLARLCSASKPSYALLHSVLYRSIRVYTRAQLLRLHFTITSLRGSEYAVLVRHMFLGLDACIFLAQHPVTHFPCPSLVSLEVELDAFFCRTTFTAFSQTPLRTLTVLRAGIHPSWIIKIVSQQPGLRHTLETLHVHDMQYAFVTGEQAFSPSDLADLHALRTVSLAYDLSIIGHGGASPAPDNILIRRFFPVVQAFAALPQLKHLLIYFHPAPSSPRVNIGPFVEAVHCTGDARIVISGASST